MLDLDLWLPNFVAYATKFGSSPGEPGNALSRLHASSAEGLRLSRDVLIEHQFVGGGDDGITERQPLGSINVCLPSI